MINTLDNIGEGIMTNTIQIGSHVSLQYQLSVDGSILEDSREYRPFKYIQGEGKLLPGFINRLQGLKAGDERNFELLPEEAHGAYSDSAIQEVLKSDLPDGVKPKVGMTFHWKKGRGDLVPYKVIGVNGNRIMLDNNHPLAGKTLEIHVQILTVK